MRGKYERHERLDVFDRYMKLDKYESEMKLQRRDTINKNNADKFNKSLFHRAPFDDRIDIDDIDYQGIFIDPQILMEKKDDKTLSAI